MNIRVHIERLVLEPGLSLNAAQLESAIGDALSAALDTCATVVMPKPGLSIDQLRGTWAGGPSPVATLGTQLAGVVREGVFPESHRGRP